MAEAMSIDYASDCQWFEEKYDELREKYAGRAVAIVNGSIFYSDENYSRFLDYLREKGLDPADICVEVFPEEDAAYIL